MNLSKDLSDFNHRMVKELEKSFASNVEPYQMDGGTLVFRGPIEGHPDPKHIGTHVAVSLDADVRRAMESANPAERDEMTQIFLANLGTRVKIEYHPTKIGLDALDIVGTMRTLKG